ncbi:DUF6657 family protein [Desulforudis sp. 1088]|uniref:DUF6657 family protein n=1 Tax=unclassified Candidatus Desulforudis TaxID=2635950 RepID=UPI00348EB1D9
MSDRIKTAWEKALERAAGINISAEDLTRMEEMDAGKALGARYIRDTNVDLEAELDKYQDSSRENVRKGLAETLLRAISLPTDETTLQHNLRAMQGLLMLTSNKGRLQSIFTELDTLFNYYAQAYKQAYLTVRDKYERRAVQTQQALEMQTGVRMRVNVERMPEFMDEWMRTLGNLNAQYEQLLAEKKERIKEII